MDTIPVQDYVKMLTNGAHITVALPDEMSLVEALRLYAASWTFQLAGGADICTDPEFNPRVVFTVSGGEPRMTDLVHPLGKTAVLLAAYDLPHPGLDPRPATGIIFGVELTDEGWRLCNRFFEFGNRFLEKITEEVAFYLYLQMTGRYLGRL